ncbi:MAG: hypothetical protein E7L17_03035 [Clostridium sp.]|uniref:hypothetical protein n=1 Tax=Clostridium sp. TaxID=1506 RepID=UPI00290FF9A2|nr:hypothetical protein [Clostridium sp.]MDU7337071.1 hypothetical protein [Clostridium sp.]
MELKYNYNERDYLDFCLIVAKQENKKTLTIAASLLAVLFIMILVSTHSPIKIAVIYALIFIFVIFINSKLENYIITKQAQAKINRLGHDFFTTDKTLCLSNKEIISTSSISVSKISFKNIAYIHKDTKFAHIEITGGSEIFIPLNTPELSEFLIALNDKCHKD